MSATATEFEVKIDDRIQRDARLLNNVAKATEYFIEQYEPRAPGNPPLKPSISWTLKPGVSPPLWAGVHERDDLGERIVERGMMTNALTDEVSRNVNMLKLWGELIDRRSDERISFLEELLRKAEELELGGRSGDQPD
jgi:hypothetical protein